MIELFYGIILTIIHFFNDEIENIFSNHKETIISLGAGVSIAYIFLSLFPELYQSSAINGYIFISLLLGFTLLHIAEKHVYQHKSSKRILKEIKEVHSVSFFIYHFLLGIIVYHFAQIDFETGLLFFIPILFHTTISNISLTEIHHHIKEKLYLRIPLAASPLLGILFSYKVPLSNYTFTIILGFTIGALLYIVIRDTIPKEKEGNIYYFITGVAIMLLLIVLTGQI